MATSPRRRTKAQVTEEIALGYVRSLSERDAGAAVAHMSDEVIDDITPVGIFRGPAEVRDFLSGLFSAFPDFELTVEQTTAGPRGAAVQWRASGTFRGGPFQGVEPTGRRVEVRGCDCIEVADEKIVRITSYYDGAAFARGVGMLPQPGSGGEKAMFAAFNALTKVRSRISPPSQ